MGKTAPQPQPTPAAPAPQASQPGQLLLHPTAALAFVLPQLSASPFSAPSASSSSAAAVPLYQRNCTLLI
jgi:hypothetical protein